MALALQYKTQNPGSSRCSESASTLLEATGGFEPPIRVLQTPALTTWLRRPGAEDGIRTRDPLLGKEVLYR
jgi:hypothetical protein